MIRTIASGIVCSLFSLNNLYSVAELGISEDLQKDNQSRIAKERPNQKKGQLEKVLDEFLHQSPSPLNIRNPSAFAFDFFYNKNDLDNEESLEKLISAIQKIESESSTPEIKSNSSSIQTEHSQTTDRFHDAEVGFNKRWEEFIDGGRCFAIWNPNWTKEELKTRYDELKKERANLYFGSNNEKQPFRELYKIPEHGPFWGSHYKKPLAFIYNLADPHYNASIISLHGNRFLAMEAPTEQNLEIFYQLLRDYQVTDLVRLTPSRWKNRENSFPYWEGNMNINPVNGYPTLKVPTGEINYTFTDGWNNKEGMESSRLLAMIQSVKNSPVHGNKVIAVHCRAGVGRTGTWIAAYTIIQEIDRQLAQGINLDQLEITIDQIFWELTLQRPFSAGHFDQYQSLYELVNFYIDALRLKKDQNVSQTDSSASYVKITALENERAE